MADIIKCPVCGESNLPDQEFCQYCQSRLQPLTGSLKGADDPIKPGQMPTKKNTAELEPILPQWLRDARDSARKSAEDDAAQAGQHTQESFSGPTPSTHDLLAGLHSQTGGEEEETPDWLANITGAAPKPKKPQTDSSEVRWVELGGAKDFAQEEPKVEPEPFMPSWLEGLAPTEPQREEKDELTDWFRQTDDAQKPQQPESQPPPFEASFSPQAEQPDVDDTPDWLKKMAADNAQNTEALFGATGATLDAPSSDTPDWLRQMAAEAGEQPNDLNVTPADASDAPDWLHQMVADDNAQNENIQTLSAGTFDAPEEKIDDAPDWLRAMGTAQDQTPGADSAVFSGSGFGETEAAGSSSEDVPDWMKNFPPIESDKPSQSTTPKWLKEEKPETPAPAEVPSWLSATSEPEQQQPPAAEGPEFGDVPSWLKASAPQSSIYEGSSTESTPESTSTSDSPDWLQAFKSLDTTGSQPSTELPSDASPEPISASDTPDWLQAFKSLDNTGSQPSTELPSDAPFEATPPAFTPGSQSGENLDALFTDMPDWLSSTSDATPSTDSPSTPVTPATPTTPTEGITPGELPSWVQAMRPVDTGNSVRTALVAGLAGDQTLESRGALAGLQGVLPSVPGYAPTSKPKAYSIKLQASEEQQAHATLLEQILAAETEPVPIASFSALSTSRGLRWLISAVVFMVLIVTFFLPTHLFPSPIGMPPEVSGAVEVSKSIPQGAPVLVAFDYEPARAGEMEAAAAPIFNLLNQPNLTVVSTSETGSILAERFISGLSAASTESGGIQYLNLGYLPGGQMGIRALAQDPARTFSLLKGISSLSQFTTLIIITDSADSARAWIEQTSTPGGTSPIVIISSAQAAPMIQPYYDSQQISGLVSGLYGGAVLEKNNGSTSGIAQTYWDAYSIGMLLAATLITIGALWNFFLGMRNRAIMGETN